MNQVNKIIFNNKLKRTIVLLKGLTFEYLVFKKTLFFRINKINADFDLKKTIFNPLNTEINDFYKLFQLLLIF